MEIPTNTDVVVASAPTDDKDDKTTSHVRTNSADLDSIKDENSIGAEKKEGEIEESKKDKDDALEWKDPESIIGSSFISTVINTINTVIGAAIISIAYSISISGVWGALVLLIAVLVPSLLTSYYMSCATLYSNEDIYGKIGRRLVNNAVGVLADISLVILDFGIDVAYMNIGFNQIEAMGKDVFNAEELFTNNKTIISLLVSLLLLFPLCCIKTMDALKLTSTISVTCVFLFVITFVILGIKGFATRGWDLNGWPKSPSDLSTSFAVFVLCFCSHVNTSKITSEIRFKKGKSKFKTRAHKTFRATCVAYIICALSYFLVGVCGYAAFGENIKDSILDNLQGGQWWYIRIGYCIVVLSSFPILGFPACITMDSYLFNNERTPKRRYVEGFIWTMCCFIVWYAIPSISSIFGITGNTCGVLLTFIWPSLYFISMYKEEQKKPVDMKSQWFKPKYYEYIIAWIILCVGIVVCIWATAMEIMNLYK